MDGEREARKELARRVTGEMPVRDRTTGVEERTDTASDDYLKLMEEHIAKKDLEERLRRAESKSWREVGLELAEDLPLVPNAIEKPLFGAAGMGLELLAGKRRKQRQGLDS